MDLIASAMSRPAPGSAPTARSRPEAILLGADDRAGLLRLIKALSEWLDEGPAERLIDVAATLNAGLPRFACRLGLVVDSLPDLRARLAAIASSLGRVSGSFAEVAGGYFGNEVAPRWALLARPGTPCDRFWDRWAVAPEIIESMSGDPRLARNLIDRGIGTVVAPVGPEAAAGCRAEGRGIVAHLPMRSHAAILALLHARGLAPDPAEEDTARGARRISFARMSPSFPESAASLPLDLDPTRAAAVWIESPGGDEPSFESTYLHADERAELLNSGGPRRRRHQRACGRIAAKEAVLRLHSARGLRPIHPHQLRIHPDAWGRPRLVGTDPPPHVSIAHCGPIAVALAAPDDRPHIGIDVEAIEPRPPAFERLAFTDDERRLLDLAPPETRFEWITRLWCAKEAVAKATGRGLAAGPPSILITDVRFDSGRVLTAIGPALACTLPDWQSLSIPAATRRRDGHAWAWTLGPED